MVKRAATTLWGMRKEFAKYFFVGITSFVLDIGSLYVFKQHLHFRPYTAVIVNQLIILNYVFLMNKHWSFKATGGPTHKQVVRFGTLTTFNYFFSIAWMWFFTEYLTIHFVHPEYSYLFVRTANVALSVAWNFFLYKYWIYRVHPPTLDSTPPSSATIQQ